MANADLLAGIEAAQAGKLPEARAILARFVQSHPESEDGWLWLGHCLRTPEKREFCYQKVLALNPDNHAARQALIVLEAQHSGLANLPSAIGQQPSIIAAIPAKKRPKWKRDSRLLYASLGFLTVILICGLPLAFLALTGNLNLSSLAALPPTSTSAPATFTPSPAPTVTSTITVVPVTATLGPTRAASDEIEAQHYAFDGQNNMNQLNFAAAIPAWDKAIELVKDNDHYYFQRATCYYSLTLLQNNDQKYRDNLINALADLNQAIAIRIDPNYFASRYETLVALGDSTDLQTDARYYYTHAAEDMNVAISWGQKGDAKRKRAAAMLYGGQCEAGLSIVNQLLEQPNQDLGYLYYLQSVGYACLGKLDEAVKAVDLSAQNGGDRRNDIDKAEYLYQLGKKQEALDVLNRSIQTIPTSGGNRYYLRALIYYEMGKKDLVQADLNTGQANTWGRGEVLAYVQGKLALEAGKREEAIKKIQFAEASLPVTYTVFGERLRDELAKLGAQPLESKLSPEVVKQLNALASIPATPLPPVASAPGPTPTSTLESSSALVKQADGTTHFIDFDGGYELTLPEGWIAFRLQSPEFYKLLAEEGKKDEFLRRLMEFWRKNDPNTNRLYAAFPASREKDLRDMAHISVEQYLSDVSPLDDTFKSYVHELKHYGFEVTREEMITTSQGLRMAVIDYISFGQSPINDEVFATWIRVYLIRTPKSLVQVSLATIYTLKDELFPELDKVMETFTVRP